MSNLHHVAIALRMYAVDNGVYPPPYNPETGEGGVSALVPLYLESLAPLRCPDDPTTPAHYGVAHHTAWDRTKFDRCYSSYNQYFNSWGFDNTGKPMENEAQARSACAGKADDLGRPLWDPGPGAGPSAVFPGLVNRNAPDNTIATRCPWHRTHLDRNSEKDLAVRLDGSVQVLDVRSYDWVTQPRDQSGARTPE